MVSFFLLMFSFFLVYALSEDGPSALPETPGEDAEPHSQRGARAVLSPLEEVALLSVTDVRRTSGFCLGTTVEHPLCTRRKGCRKTFPFFEHVVLIPALF